MLKGVVTIQLDNACSISRYSSTQTPGRRRPRAGAPGGSSKSGGDAALERRAGGDGAAVGELHRLGVDQRVAVAGEVAVDVDPLARLEGIAFPAVADQGVGAAELDLPVHRLAGGVLHID